MNRGGGGGCHRVMRVCQELQMQVGQLGFRPLLLTVVLLVGGREVVSGSSVSAGIISVVVGSSVVMASVSAAVVSVVVSGVSVVVVSSDIGSVVVST